MTIPKKIYQSWKTKQLPIKTIEAVERTKRLNPEYDYELWDDNDCRDFILKYFGENYANAFDVLVPGAFKCDFWRYAILYIKGGVYMDLDMTNILPFRDIFRDSDRCVSIVDWKAHLRPKCALYQAFIACEPNHPIMLYALQLSFANIAMRTYELTTDLSVTGPLVAGIALNLYWEKKNTYEEIKSGEYDNGIRLFEMKGNDTWNPITKQLLLNNKFEGYERGQHDYTQSKNIYKDDPKTEERDILSYQLKFYTYRYRAVLVICLIFLIPLIFIYRRKIKSFYSKNW